MYLTVFRRLFVLTIALSLQVVDLSVAVAQAAPEQATAAPEAVSSAAPAVEATQETHATTGRIHCVIFSSEGAPLSSAMVGVAEDAMVHVDDVGAAEFEVKAGPQRLLVRSTPESAPLAVEDVVVEAGQVTEVIASLAADGTLHADIMAPHDAKALAATEEVSAAVEEAVPPGTLVGRVTAVEDGTPVAEASLFVAGHSIEAKTDADGRFTVELPAGLHILSVIHPKFSTQTLRDVKIESGQQTEVAVELTPVAIELQEFVVTAPHISGGIASVMEERKNSAAVSDAIGAEDIAKLPANDAAQAAQRIVGATIVGGRFVYVRGLGERYTNALLNGAPIPSPEPDRATVPLDLFPTQVLESLDIVKTFTPDVPADFAGGSVRINTLSVPESEMLNVSLGSSYNTQSTFRNTWNQPSSATDFLGFDNGLRSLPSAVPKDYIVATGNPKPDGNLVLQSDRLALGKSLTSTFAPVRKLNLPNAIGTITYGNRWKLTDHVRIGALAALIYRRNHEFRKEQLNTYQPSTEMRYGVSILQDLDSETTFDRVATGAFASTAVEVDDDHKITLLGMNSQLGDATTRVLQGPNTNRNQNLGSVRMSYASRALTFGQLQGKHKLHALHEAEMDWVASLARAARNEDDTRDAVFGASFPPGSTYNLLQDSSNGRHYYADQSEIAKVLGLNWMQPISEDWFTTSLKTGAFVSAKSRGFEARRFSAENDGMANTDCGLTYDPVACANSVFTTNALGNTIAFFENTQPSDSYAASLNVYAGYLMGEASLGEQWKVLGGTRLEHTDQDVHLVNPYYQPPGTEPPDPATTGGSVHQLDVLPSAAVVYSPVDDMNVRASIGRTLARPQLRELGPFVYTEFFGGPATSGNPDLKLTGIVNGDLRWEYFPALREVLAFSVFAKNFTRPIEPLIVSGSGDAGYAITYGNTPGAFLYGAEAEVRKGLGFLHEALDSFSLLGSVMLADSLIRVHQIFGANGIPNVTSTHRPMVQSAPWVVNVALDFDDEDSGLQFRILYYVSGRKLVTVGALGMADIYEYPRHMVDLSLTKSLGERFSVKATVNNLLNARFLSTFGKGGAVVNRYYEGVTAGIKLVYDTN